MGYRKHEPISVEKMLKERYEGHHTICQKLREIYQLMNEDIINRTVAEKVKLNCRIAMSMAKSMHEKLKEYKNEAVGKA